MDIFITNVRHGQRSQMLTDSFELITRGGELPKRILIVDDSAAVRTLIRKGLEAQSWLEVCGEACDGMEAIEKARDLKPDLIVLDLSMPGMNGLEAAAKVQRILPRVPIILFTVHYEAAAKCAGLSGIRAVLSKAAPMDALFAEIHRVLVAA